MDTAQRIAQFENMVQADPGNDMAHFSLAGAYAQSGRPADAAASYLACIARNPAMSKAYELAGKAFLDAGDRAAAVDVLSRGYAVSAERGDRKPHAAIGELLSSLGERLPEVALKLAPPPSPDQGTFLCRQSGQPGHQLPRPPFRGPVGQWIYENISKETFAAWVAQGTKVINELRLDLSRDEDALTYDRHMREYFGIDDDLHAKLAAAPAG